MLAITHLIVTLLLITLLNLDKNDSFVALLFGVFIDVDHLLGLKDYVAANGLASVLDLGDLMQPEGQWKSMFHNPVAVMVVGPVSTGSRLALPLLFWGVHMVMDYLQEAVLGLFSVWEVALLAGSFLALASVAFRRYAAANPGCGFRDFAGHVMDRVSRPWRSLTGAVSRALGQ